MKLNNTSLSNKKILITGGAGFIGSHIVEAMAAANPGSDIVVLDKMTYAAHPSHLERVGMPVRLVVGDINDKMLVNQLMDGVDILVHAAAESHVDRSFGDPFLFTVVNMLGTHVVMEAARQANVSRIIHISTDEVYGEVLTGSVAEDGAMHPSNPYSASKAGAEMVVEAYRHSFKLPAIVVRANNAYGIRQFPEKLIPKCIMSLINGDMIPLHGDGSAIRHYLGATDFAEAVVLLAEKGTIGEAYNIGANVSYTNAEVARMICEAFGVPFEENVSFTDDRPFNDRRYAVDYSKIAELGWHPTRSLADDVPRLVEWYRENADIIHSRLAVDDVEALLDANAPVVAALAHSDMRIFSPVAPL